MQTNHPKQPQPPIRQRPLQKSMFLPDQYSPQTFMHPHTQKSTGEFSNYNPMKRSLHQIQAINPQSPQYQFRTQNNQSFASNNFQQSSAIHGQYLTLDQRTGTRQEILNHSNSLTNIKQGSMMIDRSNERNFDKNLQRADNQPINQVKTVGKSFFRDLGYQEKMVSEIINLIKEKHLPNLVNIVKKQLQDELNSFKKQLNNFKEQFKNHVQKQETINIQLRSGSYRLTVPGNGNDKSSTIKNTQKNGDMVQIQKELVLLQGRLNKLEGTTNQNFTFFGQELDKLNHHFQQKLKQEQKNLFKVSAIKSNLPAVMLEYKQLFSVKKISRQHIKRAGDDEEIILSVCEYFVDKQGFLMDNENHYLVDYKGIQIRLQEKHIKILQHYKVLHR